MGCGCRDKDMSEPQGNYKMKFICDKNGRLLKGAPGNYECGKVYLQPYRMSKFKFWELVEPVPELEVPPPSEEDSVYVEPYVPDEEEEVEVTPPASVEVHQPLNVPDDEDVNIDPNTPATIEPYVKYNPASGKITGISHTGQEDETLSIEIEPEDDTNEEEIIEELTREEIFKLLDDAGIEYSKHTATKYLMEQVEELPDASTQE